MHDDERWRPIPDYPNYEASSLGRIRNRRLGHVLVGTATKNGYRQVSVRDGHRRKVAYVHRLVAFAFHGLPPAGFVCNHLDGVKRNNRPVNLEWVTPAANARHAAALGLFRSSRLPGERNPAAKLTDDRVREMRARRQGGALRSALAKEYGVTPQAAHMVVARKTWRHVV